MPDNNPLETELLRQIQDLIREVTLRISTPVNIESNSYALYLNMLNNLVSIRAMILEQQTTAENRQEILTEIRGIINQLSQLSRNLNNPIQIEPSTLINTYLTQLTNSTQSLKHAEPPEQYTELPEFLDPNKTRRIKNRINDPALGLELFKTYRSMIEHEDNLLNQRLTWFLVAQGFLFGAFATVLGSNLIFTGNFWWFLPWWFFPTTLKKLVLLGISGVGIINSLSIYWPMAKAMKAATDFADEWKDRFKVVRYRHINYLRVNSKVLTPQVFDILPNRISGEKYGIFSSDQPTEKSAEDEITVGGWFLVWNNKKGSWFAAGILLIPILTGLVWFFLFGFVFKLNMNSSELKSVEQPQKKSGEVYILADKTTLEIDQNEVKLLKFQTCTRVDNKKQVLVVAPKSSPSFHLPKDIAELTLSSLKKRGIFKKLTVDEGSLKDCQ